MIRSNRFTALLLALGILVAGGLPAWAQDKAIQDKDKSPDKIKEKDKTNPDKTPDKAKDKTPEKDKTPDKAKDKTPDKTKDKSSDKVKAPEKIKEPVKQPPLTPLAKPNPETVDDLRAMEKQVQLVLQRVSPSVVAVVVGPGQGSGVIVSPDGLVLTAGHVSKNPNESAIIILNDGRRLKAKSLGRNGGIDSGMVKILEGGPFPYVEMAQSAKIKAGEWCIAVGHPGGFRSNRGLVTRVGRVLFNSNSFIRTDCALVGGDSGGPLFDMQGRVIGIHSRIGNKLITENMHVPVDTYHQTWDRLVKGEAWGGNFGGARLIVESAEGKIVFEKKGDFTAKDPFDAKMKHSHSRVFKYIMRPGFAYTIDLTTTDKTLDPFLRLEDAAGMQLAENDDGGGELNSRIVYRPSREQEYRVIATTFEGGQTGPFHFTIRQNEIVARDLPTGKVDVLDALKLQKPSASKLVGQFAKMGFNPFANAHLFDESGKPIAGKEITFTWKSGKTTVKTDDQGQARVQFTNDKMDGLTLAVPDGLKALVRITDEEGNPLPKMGGGKKKFMPSAPSGLSSSLPPNPLLTAGHVVKTWDGLPSPSEMP